ncbi:hypothetical protein EDC04DRAFT_2654848 [Pisolithus marmoratus]|nr:hypothetical protein EDC04DRAFT_2654848 [Pisolithus marmoratus]
MESIFERLQRHLSYWPLYSGQPRELPEYFEDVYKCCHVNGIFGDPLLIATALLGAPADVMPLWAYLVEPAYGNWESFKLQVVQQYPEIKPLSPRASKDPSLSCECASGNSCAGRVSGMCSEPSRLVSRSPLLYQEAVDSLIPEWQVHYLAWKESHPSVFAPSSCPPQVSCSPQPPFLPCLECGFSFQQF